MTTLPILPISNARQMINLFGTNYAIGVQSSTTYFRSNSRFSWFRLGSHSDTQSDPGTGGSVLMTLKGGVHNDGYVNAGGGVELMHLVQGGLYVNGTLASTSDRRISDSIFPAPSRARRVIRVVLRPPSRGCMPRQLDYRAG